MNDMAPYLRSTTSTIRSSLSTIISPPIQTSFTLPTPSSVRIRRQQNRMSAEYPSGYHRPGKQQQRLSLMLSDQQNVRINDSFREKKRNVLNKFLSIHSYSELTNRDM
jgi:hypothetical protein